MPEGIRNFGSEVACLRTVQPTHNPVKSFSSKILLAYGNCRIVLLNSAGKWYSFVLHGFRPSSVGHEQAEEMVFPFAAVIVWIEKGVLCVDRETLLEGNFVSGIVARV